MPSTAASGLNLDDFLVLMVVSNGLYLGDVLVMIIVTGCLD
jgi:hypothetical protein